MMKKSTACESCGTRWFVSRHPGAIAWARAQHIVVHKWVAHLDLAQIRAGDTVIGTLPVNMVADVCARGARYLHLTLSLPAEWRGRELSVDEMTRVSAELKAFHVAKVD
jgi:CRISPR-associated protein Csx16